MRRGSQTRPSAPGSRVRVDLSQAETRVLLPEGDYLVKVDKVTQEESKEGNPYLSWVFRTIDDDKKYNGKPLYTNTSLQPQALWNLRNLLESLGEDIPDSEFDLDFEDLVGKQCVVAVEDDEWEGRKRSKITDYTPVEGGAPDDETEPEPEPEKEAPAPTKTRGRPKKVVEPKPDPEPEDDLIDAADVRNMDEDQLQALIDEHELDVDLDSFATLRRKVNAVIDGLEAKELLAAE